MNGQHTAERSDLIGQRETISGDQLFNLSSKLVKFPNLLKLAKTSPYSRQAKKWKQGTTDPFSSTYFLEKFWKNACILCSILSYKPKTSSTKTNIVSKEENPQNKLWLTSNLKL